MEQIILISAILQWVVLVGSISFTLALLRVVGSGNAHLDHVAESAGIASLRGINVADVEPLEPHTGASRGIRAILNGKPALLVVTDPSCASCDRRVAELLGHELASPSDAILAVRGPKAVVDQFASDLPGQVRIITEDLALGLRAFNPPFATVLTSDGSYSGFVRLESERDSALAWRTLQNQQSRERMYGRRHDLVVSSTSDGAP